jgi:chromosome segregation ATPase
LTITDPLACCPACRALSLAGERAPVSALYCHSDACHSDSCSQAAIGPLEARLAGSEAQVGELASALEAAKAELHEAIALSGDNLAARVKEESAGAAAELEAQVGAVASALEAAKAELHEAIALSGDNLAARIREESVGAAADSETRSQQLAADISGLRESMAEQTREMATLVEEAEGLRSAREEAGAAVTSLRTELGDRVGALEQTTGEGLQMAADRLAALEKTSGGALQASQQLEALTAEVGTHARTLFSTPPVIVHRQMGHRHT